MNDPVSSCSRSGGSWSRGVFIALIGLFVVGAAHAAVPVVSSSATASGTVGVAFSYQITASNTPTSYAATGLPGGLSVSSTSGLISGTPTAAATTSVTVKAINSSGTGTKTVTLTVAKGTQAAVAISSSATTTFGATYTATATGGSGTGAITWALGTGSTAAGAAVNASTGVVTYTGLGTVKIKAFRAADTNYNQSATTADFTITVSKGTQAAVTISSAATASLGSTYTATATGGSGTGAITWALGTGSTAAGAAINASTGVVAYTGTGTVKIKAFRAADTNYNQSATTADFTITVSKGTQAAVTITSAATTTLGAAYTATATGGSGTGAITWALGTGSTATGAAINASTGVVSYTGLGTVKIKAFRAADTNYNQSATTADFTITVGKNNQAAVTITSAASTTYGAAYTATATGGSGTGAITWALGTGSTATGAAINASTGVVTFTSPGTVVFNAFRAADSTYNQSATTANFTLTVGKATQAAVTISSAATGTYGTAYTATATGGTGTGAITWALGTGSTATGAAINASTGVVTFTSPGTVVFNAFRAADTNYNQSATTANFTLTVGKAAQAAVTISSAATGTYGTAYTATATGGTGTGAITWTLGAGSTATGAAINASTGVVTFTSPGTVVFNAFRAADTNYNQSATTANFTLTISKGTQTAVTISSAATGTYGTAYTATATGGSGTGAITWALGTGSTATGAAINASTGVVTFTSPGTVVFNAFRAADTNYNQSATTANFTLTVSKGTQAAVTISSVTTGTYGTAYTATATGGSGTGAITWALGTGSTATGAAINASTGVVTFTSPGTVVFNAFRAADTNYNQSATTANFTLTVGKATQGAVTISSAATGTYGIAYTATATGGSGTGAITWALGTGSTATGAAINASTGVVTFTSPGTVVFNAFRAADTNYNQSTTTANFTLTVGKATQTAVTISSAATGTYGSAYTATATGGSGTGAITWALGAGSTAAGAAIDASTGVVTVTSPGTVVFNAFRAGDTNYNQSATTANFTLTVSKAAQAAVTISSAATVAYGTAYTATASGGSGSGALVWTLAAGSTAPGAAINSSTGVVTSTGPGTVVFNVFKSGDANYNQSTTSANFTLSVSAASPVINSTLSVSGTVNTAFTYQITATNTPTSFAATGLPAGLAINTATGAITGTPTVAATSNVALGATNAGGTGNATLVLTINGGAPVITSATTASGKTYTAFTYQITATNTPTSFDATGLPPGLTVDTATGLISGSPTANGTSVITLSATNPGGTGTAILNLSLLASLPYTADFENSEGYSLGSIHGQLGWTVSQGFSTVTADDYFSGSQSLQLAAGGTPALVSQTFASDSTGVVYFDFFVKPVADPDLSLATVFSVENAKFAFQGSGGQAQLQVFRGNGSGGGTWAPTTATISLNASNQSQSWVRLTARVDFANQTWDIYADSKMVAANVPAVSPGTYLSQFKVQGNQTALSRVDYIYAGAANPVFADQNNNGIDDVWESEHGLSLSSNNRDLSPAGNGVTVIQAYVAGSDTNDFYNGVTPTLLIVGGNNQVTPYGQFNSQAFDVGVWNSAGTAPLVGAPVTFAVQNGGGKLAISNTGSPALATSLTLTTDVNGTAQAYYLQPTGFGVASTVTVTAGSAQTIFNTATAAGAVDSNGNGLADAWEVQYFGALGVNPTADADGDGLTNLQEYLRGTIPTALDSNGDGVNDGFEAVTELGATALNQGQVSLVWTSGVRAASAVYEVERKLGAGSFVKVGETGGNGYTDSGLTAATAYTYRVRIRVGTPTGVYSAQVTATTLSASAPTLPATGLRLWLAADAISATNGDRVGTWSDQSGLNNHATQANASQKPVYVTGQLNGRPVLRFSHAEGRLLSLPNVMNGASAGEVFVVLKAGTASGTTGLWKWNSGNAASSYGSSDNSIFETFGSTTGYGGGAGLGIVAPPLSQFNLYNVSAQTNAWQVRLNGQTLWRSVANTPVFGSAPWLGADHNDNDPYGAIMGFDGDIAEVILYDHALTATDREAVASYLANKYALFAAPATVSGLTATALNQSQVSLAWTGSSRGDKVIYEIERKLGAGSFAKVGETSGNGWTDSGLIAASAYTYRVRMRALSGTGGYSAEAGVTTLATPALPSTGVRLWLSADAIVAADGDRVTIWPDQSGLGNDATQANGQQKPKYVAAQLNGRPVLRFSNGDARFLTLPNVMSSAVAGEAFVVLKAGPSTGAAGLWKWNVAAGSSYRASDNSISETFGTNGVNSLGPVAPNLDKYHVYDVSAQANDWNAFVNGISVSHSSSNTVAFGSTPWLGADHNNNDPYGALMGFEGDIAEVLLYDHVLTAAERDAVSGFFANKYSLYSAPVAVTGLTATVISGTQINLGWQPLAREEAFVYEVERKLGSGSFAKIGETTGQSYFDSGLTANSAYSYRVRMKSTAGVGTYSNVAAATTATAGATDLATSGLRLWLKADGLGTAGPVSRWTDQSGSGNDALQPSYGNRPQLVANAINGRPVLRFDAAQKQSLGLPNLMNLPTAAAAGEVFVVVKSNVSAGTTNNLWSFNLRYLTNDFGNVYAEGVSGHYPEGDGSLSDSFGSSNVHGPMAPVVSPGQYSLYNVSAEPGLWTARQNDSVLTFAANNTVEWTQPAPTLGSRQSSYYTFYDPNYFSGDIAEVLIYARVLSAAERTAVQGYLTQKYNLGFADTTPPSVPSGLAASAVTTSSLTLSWAASTDNVGVTGYDVYANDRFVSSVSNPSATLNGLLPNSNYTLTVKAKDAAGNTSAASSAVVVATADTLAPGAPFTLTVANVTATTLTLSWKAPGDNYGVVGYQIYKNGLLAGSSPIPSFALSGLTGGTTYALTVKAKDAAGNLSADSAPLSVATAPSAPVGLAASNIAARSFTLTWATAPAGAGVVAYDVYLNGAWAGSSTTTSFAVTGLNAATGYSMSVKAKDAAGQVSLASVALVVTTGPADLSPPTVPTNLAASGVAPTSVTLSWTASSDNVGVVAYNIYRDGMLVARVAGTTTLIAGLTPVTSYSLTVAAEDAYGNMSAPSTAVNVTTSVATPLTSGSGLRLWLAADALTATNGDRIATWPDQSGHGYDATQGSNSNRPVYVTAQLNGRPVLRFSNAEGRFMALPNVMSGATAGEAFVVVKAGAAAGTTGLWKWQQGGSFSSYGSNDNSIVETFGTTTAHGAGSGLGVVVPALNQFNLYNVSSQTNDWQARLNGRTLWRSTINTAVFGPNPWIGAEHNDNDPYGAIFGFDGDVAEVIFYDHALNAVEREAVGSYLATKYALFTAPAAVTALTATPLNQAQVSLAWTSAVRPDEVVYEVERKTGAGNFAKLGETSSTAWTDSGLTAATAYTYRVRVRALSGTSAYSAQAAATTLATTTLVLPSAGMRLWLSADNVNAANGDRVSQWADQSGLNNHATQINQVQRPVYVTGQLNGRPVLRFNHAEARFLALPDVMTGAAAGEAFVVVKAGTASGTTGLWKWNVGSGSSYGSSDNSISETFGTTSFYANGSGLGVVTPDLGQFNLYNVVAQSNDWQARLNGRTLARSTINTVAFVNSPWIGADHNNNDPYGAMFGFDGDIAEVILYDHALTATEREAVGSYLANKYALFPAPVAVTGLTATALNQAQVSLAWTSVARPDLGVYEVERKSGAGSFVKMGETAGNGWTDSGLTSATAYTYRVRLRTLSGTSGYSTETTATTLAASLLPLPATGMRLWLAADAVAVANGARVSVWPDQSGRGNDAVQTNNIQRPVYVTGQVNGRPVLRFSNAESRFLSLPDVMAGVSAGEVFVVLKAAPNAAGLWKWSNGGGSNYRGIDNSISETFGTNSVYATGRLSLNLDQYHLYNVSAQANDWQARVNGVSLYKSTTNTVSFWTNPWIGADHNNNDPYGATWGFEGDIAEMIVYDHVLSATDREAVATFLANKYALFAAPVAVGGLSVANVGGSQVSLTWMPVNRSETVVYEIERRAGNGAYTKIGETSGLSFFDSGLTAGTAYTYRVRMRSTAGYGSYSGESMVTTPATGVTDLSTSGLRLWLKADSLSTPGPVERWADQSGSSNDALQPGFGARPAWVANAINGRPVLRFDAAQGQSFALPNLMNLPAVAAAGEVFVVVKSNAAAGAPNNLWSFNANFPTNEFGNVYLEGVSALYPGPDGSIADSFGSRDVHGSITPSASVAQYNLYNVSAEPGRWTARLNGGILNFSNQNTVEWTQPAPSLGSRQSSYYTFYYPNFFSGDVAEVLIYARVLTVAERTAVEGYLNQKYNLDSGDTVAPSVPTDLVATAVTISSISLSWTASIDNVAVSGYDVYLGGQFYGSVAGTSATLTGLLPNANYTLTVKAKDAAGNTSAASAALIVATADTQAPSAPFTLSVADVTATSLTLVWKAPGDNYGVTGYEIYQNGTLVGTSSIPSFALGGLTGSTTYSLTVKALDAAGNRSAASAALAVTTLPSAPGGLAASAIAGNSFTLAWTAAPGGAGIVAYDVYVNGTWAGSSTTASYAVTGLNAATAYSVTVSARDAASHASLPSAPLVVTTGVADLSAPTVPTNLAASGIAPTSVTLTWTVSTDNVGVVAYDIYRDGILVSRASGSPALLTGLSPNATYALAIAAEDAAGNISAPSTAINVTTSVATPLTSGSGLRLWLAADVLTATNGDRIATWTDQSGHGYNATQGSAPNQPVYVTSQLNGRPVLRFSNAEGRFMALPNVMSGATAGEAFVVVKAGTAGGATGLWKWQQGGAMSSYGSSDNSILETFGTTTAHGAGSGLGVVVPALNQFNLYNVSSQTNDWQARLNGRTLWRSTTNTAVFGANPWIGAEHNDNDPYGALYGFDGDIAEVIFYDHVLNAAEREAVGGYLATKYALFSAPAVVTALTATPLNQAQVSLTWTSVVRPDEVVYEVERKIGAGNFAKVGETSSTAWTDSGLAAATAYTYRVRVRALGGTSAYSTTATATTLATTALALPSAGMRLWLSADTVSAADGDRVAIWSDRSGLNNHATQLNTVQKPVFVAGQLNGRPVLRFNHAESRVLTLPNVMSGATAGEAFVVVKAGTAAGTTGLWKWNVGSGSSYGSDNNSISETFGTTSVYADAAGLGVVTPALGQFNLYNVLAQPNDWQARLNGRTLTRSTTNTVAFVSTPWIGADHNNNDPYGAMFGFDGDIAEVIVYDHALSANEREAVGSYLANKYALYATPAAVTGLSATALNQTQVSLTWSVVARPDQVVYEVERKTGAGSFAKVGETAGNGWTDSGLTSATAYTYRVRTRALSGTSGYSTEASATTLTTAASALPASGMRLWLAADAVNAADGDRVRTWADQSGRGNDATQTVTTQKPVYVAGQVNGRPVLRFSNAENRYLVMPDVMAGAFAGEAFVVLKAGPTAASTSLWKWSTSAGSSYGSSDNSIAETFGTSGSYTSGSGLGPVAPDLSQFHLYDVSAQANDWQARVNGITLCRSTTNTVAFGSTSPLLGTDGAGGLDGDVAEVIVYDHVLTAGERDAVGNYLAGKYALYAAPAAVTALAATPVSSTQVSLGWTSAARTDAAVFEIERKTGAGAYVKIAETTGLGYFDSNLTAATAYTYRVRLRVVTGYGAYSNEPVATTLATTATDLPASGLRLWLKADGLGIAGPTERWTDQSAAANDAVQGSFSNRPVWVANAVNGRPVLRFDAAQAQGYLLPNLMNVPTVAQAGDVYAIVKSSAPAGTANVIWTFGTVYSLNESNNLVPYSVPSWYPNTNGFISEAFGSDVVRNNIVPANALGQFNLYNVTAQSVSWAARLNGVAMLTATANTMSWSASSPLLGARAGGYNDPGSFFAGDIAEVMIYDRALTTDERAVVTTYLAQKYNLNTTVVPDTTPPSVPTNVRSTNPTGSSFILRWNPSTDDLGVAGYDVYKNGVLIGSTTGTSFTVTGLTPGTAYSFTVKARDASGNPSAVSSTFSFTPVDTIKPSTPANLRVTAVGPRSFSLAWDASTDDVGVTGYAIYLSGAGQWATSSTATYTENPSLLLGSRTFYVRALDAAGNSSTNSAMVTLTIPAVVQIPASGMIAAGGNNSAAINSQGAFYAWGLNSNGQLGDGTTTLRTGPVAISSNPGTSIALGANHGLIIYSDGSLGAWGLNTNGQVGNGTTTQQNSAVLLSPTDVIAVAAGASHSLALGADGTVWGWGLNANGQVGDGTTTQRTAPVQIPGLTGIVAIAAGASHSLAVKSDGTVWVWGLNANGQLGNGTTTQQLSPQQLTTLSGVASVFAGQNYSFALKADGTVAAWGANASGQLGDGTTTQQLSPVVISSLTNVRSMAAGLSHSVAVKADGTVWTWGANTLGQLGDNSTQRSTPAQLPSIAGALAVAAGQAHTLVLRSDGSINTFGDNSAGQLGDGIVGNLRLKPVQATTWSNLLTVAGGGSHGVLLRADNSVATWGLNASGQLGDGTLVNHTVPAPLPSLTATAIGAGTSHTLAVTTTGTVKAWGLNANGQLGDGTTTTNSSPVNVSTLTSVTSVAAGGSHSLARKTTGEVWSWGLNSSGQLGDNSTTQRTAPVQVRDTSSTFLSGIGSIAAGSLHSLAVKTSDGSVWAWGINTNGRLGDGTTTQRLLATQVKTDSTHFLTNVVGVSAGSAHSLAVKSDGTVWAWGLNGNGQLGDGTTTSRSFATQVSGLTNIVAVAAGATHSVALGSDGVVHVWGLNTSGQLGDGTTTQRNSQVALSSLAPVASIAAGDNSTYVRLTDNTLRVWGSNASGQLGVPMLTPSLAALNVLTTSATDTDRDGLPDAWEIARFSAGNTSYTSGTDDPDGDGLTNIEEYLLGTDPTQANADLDPLTDLVDAYPSDYFNNASPVLAVVSGNNQTAMVNAYTALPLKVSVSNSSGAALANAPVKFKVLSGGGKLAVTNTGSPTLVTEISLTTDASGFAQIYYREAAFTGVVSQIQFTAGPGQLTLQSTSSSAAGDTDNDNLTDAWETAHFGNLTQTGSGDFDGDGITNLEEFLAGTDPAVATAATSPAIVKLSVWTPLQ